MGADALRWPLLTSARESSRGCSEVSNSEKSDRFIFVVPADPTSCPQRIKAKLANSHAQRTYRGKWKQIYFSQDYLEPRRHERSNSPTKQTWRDPRAFAQVTCSSRRRTQRMVQTVTQLQARFELFAGSPHRLRQIAAQRGCRSPRIGDIQIESNRGHPSNRSNCFSCHLLRAKRYSADGGL